MPTPEPWSILTDVTGQLQVIEDIVLRWTAKRNLPAYRPHIPIHPDWPIATLNEATDFISGFAFKSADMTATPLDSTYQAVVKIGIVGRDGRLDMADAQFRSCSDDLRRFALRIGDIVMAMTGATVGKVTEVDRPGLLVNQRAGVLQAKPTTLQSYLLNLLCSTAFYNYCQRTAGGGAQGNIASREILEYPIPIPPLPTQQVIVAEIEAEPALVAASRELITRFEKKIRNTLARIWGDESSLAVTAS